MQKATKLPVSKFAAAEYARVWKESGVETSVLTGARIAARSGRKKGSAPATIKTLDDVQTWLGDCRRCGLCKERNKIVFGSGNPETKLLFVGEGPGADEDKQGFPFVGRAGGLLTKIVEAMNYRREDIYIANVVKCRPPQNRVPLPDEIASCLPFLKAQIELIQPQVIVALGLTAATALTGNTTTMGNLRGRFHPLHWNANIQVMPTYHPAYLLRNPDAKRIVWDDMKLVLGAFGQIQ